MKLYNLGLLEIEFGIFKLGGVVVRSLTNVEFNALATFLGNASETEIVKSFLRCKIKNTKFASQQYTRVKIRNSYTVIYTVETGMAIGQVQYYFQYKDACHRLPICDEGCVCPLYNLAMLKIVKLVSDPNEYLVP